MAALLHHAFSCMINITLLHCRLHTPLAAVNATTVNVQNDTYNNVSLPSTTMIFSRNVIRTAFSEQPLLSKATEHDVDNVKNDKMCQNATATAAITLSQGNCLMIKIMRPSNVFEGDTFVVSAWVYDGSLVQDGAKALSLTRHLANERHQ